MPTHTAPTTAAITPPFHPRGPSSAICNMKQPKLSTCQVELLVDLANTELGEIKPGARVWKNDTGDHAYHFGKQLPSFLTTNGACELLSYTRVLFSAFTCVPMSTITAELSSCSRGLVGPRSAVARSDVTLHSTSKRAHVCAAQVPHTSSCPTATANPRVIPSSSTTTGLR